MKGQLIKRRAAYIVAALICVLVASHAQTKLKQSNRALAAGRRTFESSCAPCHGLNGRGGERAPDIATRPEIVSLPDSETLKVLRDGILEKGMPRLPRWVRQNSPQC